MNNTIVLTKLLEYLYEDPERCERIVGFQDKFSKPQREFIKSVVGQLRCPITQELVQNPVVCCKNGHIVGEEELNKWVTAGNHRCPSCGSQALITPPRLDLSIYRCLNDYLFSGSLMISCPINFDNSWAFNCYNSLYDGPKVPYHLGHGRYGMELYYFDLRRRKSDVRLFRDEAEIQTLLRREATNHHTTLSMKPRGIAKIWHMLCYAFSYLKPTQPHWFHMHGRCFSIYTLLTPVVFLSLALVLGPMAKASLLSELMAVLTIMTTVMSTLQYVFSHEDVTPWGVLLPIVLSGTVILAAAIFLGVGQASFGFFTGLLPLLLTVMMTMRLFDPIFSIYSYSYFSGKSRFTEAGLGCGLAFFAVAALTISLLLAESLSVAMIVGMIGYMLVETTLFCTGHYSHTKPFFEQVEAPKRASSLIKAGYRPEYFPSASKDCRRPSTSISELFGGLVGLIRR